MPDRGVLLIEPHGPLRAEDFEAIALTVDPWIEAHNVLHGLVLHVPQFPGWDNFGALLSHLHFVWDHHRKVQRVALAADGKISELAAKLAAHFVQAKLKHFDYGELEEALAWVSGPTTTDVKGDRDGPAAIDGGPLEKGTT